MDDQNEKTYSSQVPANSLNSNQNEGQNNQTANPAVNQQVANVTPTQTTRFNPNSIYPQVTEDNPVTNPNNTSPTTLENAASKSTKSLSNKASIILTTCCVIIAIPLIISLTGHVTSIWLSYFAPNPTVYFSFFNAFIYKVVSVIVLVLVAGVFLRKEQLRKTYLTLAAITFVISLYFVIKTIVQIHSFESIPNSGVNFNGISAKFYESIAYSYIVGFILP